MSDVERHFYFDIKELTEPMLKGAFKFALDVASEKQSRLTIVVNNIGTNQCIEKIFGRDSINANKLNRRETIQVKGVDVQLKSPKGLDNYIDYGVVLAIHPAKSTIQTVEANSKLSSFIVFAELQQGIDNKYLHDWVSSNSANELSPS